MVHKKQRRMHEELTEPQQRKLRKFVIVVVVTACLSLLFAPEIGFLSLIQKKRQYARLSEEIARLEKENFILQEEIRRFNNDPVFLEKVAREGGFLGENELIFDFSKPEEKK